MRFLGHLDIECSSVAAATQASSLNVTLTSVNIDKLMQELVKSYSKSEFEQIICTALQEGGVK